MSKLYVMCGAPGSGKSTWIQTHMNSDKEVWVSRDTIRFAMVSDEEEYFSKEPAVFKEFINQINHALRLGYDVYADATHLNRASRGKLLRAVNSQNYDTAEAIWIKTPVETAIAQNDNRQNTRSFVPRSVIRRMHAQMDAPEFDEGFSVIYIVEPNKPIAIKKEIK